MRTVPEFPPALRAVAALVLFLLAFCVAAAVAVAQDSTATAPATSSLAPALWMLVPVVAFVLIQGLKAIITPIEKLPPLAKQVLAVLIAAGLTYIAAKSGVPIPTNLAEIDQTTIEQVVSWLLTVLVGGSSAVGIHAVKKSVVG